MPRRTDIKSILIIGAGPIVIGQACEFDYSGVQACKALKDEGYRVILVNSNPATIMTDPEFADRTYIEPLTREYLEEIIRVEREMSPGAGFAVLERDVSCRRVPAFPRPKSACISVCQRRRNDARGSASGRRSAKPTGACGRGPPACGRR